MPNCFECAQPATTTCRYCGAPLCERCRIRSGAWCAGQMRRVAAARHAAVVDELEREAVEAGDDE